MDTSNKIISFQKEQKQNSINLLDILKYLLYNWKWILLSVLLFGGFYFYQYSKTPYVYSKSQTVMIKTPMNTQTTARLTRSNMAYNAVSVAGEILQLKSKELMRQTISRAGADISYSIDRGLRDYELYKKSPIQVKRFGVSEDKGYAFTVTPIDSRNVWVRNWDQNNQGAELKVPLNKETQTPIGKIIISPTEFYSKSAFGETIRVTKLPLEQFAGYFLGNLEIKQLEDDASLLRITLNDRSPERAEDILSMLINVYNEVALKDKNKIAVNTANFIDERLAIIEKELGGIEAEIDRFRTLNQGVDVMSGGQMFYSESQRYQSERSKVETDRRLAEMMKGYTDRSTRQNELIPSNTGLVDGNVEEQISSYNSTLLRRNRLVEGGNSANPVVQDLDNTLNAMRRNINRAIDNSIAGLDIRIRNILQDEQRALGQAAQMPSKQRMMLSLERQQKVKEELYVYLLNKTEENALNQAMADDNVRIVDPASGSDFPISPKLAKKLMVGIAIGLALPILILLILLMVNTKVRSRKEIQELLSVPFLGEIPLTKTQSQAEREILVSKVGRDILTETFRILRTNIQFMANDGNAPQVITFTSLNTAAGKTFIALNLAATFAYLNKKVVVLDLDLRKGTMSLPIETQNGKGVSHYLSDPSVIVDDIIYQHSHESNLDFVPIGVVAPNPVELLMSTRLDQLVRELRNRYDYVIVDGVPIGVVADASIVDRVTDLTLFIIRSGKMDRRTLPEIQALYEEKKLSNLAIVLNGMRLGGGYGYGYYGYGYGYGYGVEKRKNFFARWLRI